LELATPDSVDFDTIILRDDLLTISLPRWLDPARYPI
jgi:hypothetical protein